MAFLSKQHRILEKPTLEFRPFGKDAEGQAIQDVSGISVKANLEYLEDLITKRDGPERARQVLEELIDRLNARILDPAYHVTLDFLRNPWNSYSYEFVMYVVEICVQLTGQQNFAFNLGREKFLSPIVQILGRPFSIMQIYRLYPYFVEKFTKGALKPEVRSLVNGHAVMRLQLSDSTIRQFGPYLQGCAERICQTTKATIAEVPSRMFGRPPATIQDSSCMAEGAPYCEWTFSWEPQGAHRLGWSVVGGGVGLLTFVFLWMLFPEVSIWAMLGGALLAVGLLFVANRLWVDRNELQEHRKIIQEQFEAAEQRHEALREAYINQEHIVVEMRRRVDELSMLHQLTLTIGSTLDKQTIIDAGLQAIVHSLPFDQSWFVSWDPSKEILCDIRTALSSNSVTSLGENVHISSTPENFLYRAIQTRRSVVFQHDEAWLNTCPPLKQIEPMDGPIVTGMVVPISSQTQPLGVLLVGKSDRTAISGTDQNIIKTVGHQLGIALDSARAYEEIEGLNRNLEGKVIARTAELQEANRSLEAANIRLQELDRAKSKFLSHCSHELRTPLTSIKGFTENMLQGLVGPLVERQHLYLTRINANANRLTRMIGDLLDLSRIEAGTIRLDRQTLCLPRVFDEVTQELLPLTESKGQRLTVTASSEDLTVLADPDRLHQILTNILHNAHKFTPREGRIHLEGCVASPDRITITVTDTGPGISEEAQEKLFNPFYQAHRVPEIGTQGLGLGLSIVKQLVDLQEGSISVESALGRGTTFSIQMPRGTLASLASPI